MSFDTSISGAGFINRSSLRENIDNRRCIWESITTTMSEVIDARTHRVRRTERRYGRGRDITGHATGGVGRSLEGILTVFRVGPGRFA